MSAHIVFPALDPTEPATLSPKILKDFLRTKLGFHGLITTDALEMKAVADRYPPPVLARKAFTAGVDVLLLTSSGERTRLMFESLVDGFKKGASCRSSRGRD
jgi:beta-N-acetylhexosaminidase